MAKGLTWTTAHLRAAHSPEDVRTSLAEAATHLGTAPIAPETVLSLLEEVALESARLRKNLQAATRAREVLLASVAHDLRNPLNTFAMSAGLLRDDLESPELDKMRALNLLSRMDRASVRMQALIEDLLEASRVEAGVIEVKLRPEQASVIARAVIEKAKPAVSEKGAKLEEGAIADLSVDVDRQRTMEALDKLVAVALKSTGEGGVIRVGVENAHPNVLFTIRATPPRGGTSNVPPFDENRGGLALLIARGLLAAQGAQLGTEASPEGPRIVATFATFTPNAPNAR